MKKDLVCPVCGCNKYGTGEVTYWCLNTLCNHTWKIDSETLVEDYDEALKQLKLSSNLVVKARQHLRKVPDVGRVIVPYTMLDYVDKEISEEMKRIIDRKDDDDLPF